MNTDQVKNVLTELLGVLRQGEAVFPGSTAVKYAEDAINYILGHPLAIEFTAMAFDSAEALVAFLLGRFGIPAGVLAAVLARLGIGSSVSP